MNTMFNEYITKRCFRCRWSFQCHRSRADRIYCRACEDNADA
jgi:hypothetical protein